MKPHRIGWAVLAFWGLASLAWGDDALTPIADVVNQQTFAVMRVDLAGIDFDALEKWAKQNIEQSTALTPGEQAEILKKIRESLQTSRDWVGRFTKAGGKTLWIVAINSEADNEPVFIAVPLAGGAEVAALEANFRGPPKDIPADEVKKEGTFIQAGNVLAYAPDPTPFKIMPAEARPDFAQALAAAGPGVVQIAFVPSADLRRKIEDSLGPPPDGQPPAVLTQAVSSATFSLQAPPRIGAHLICQSPDKASAAKLYNLLKAYIEVGKDFVKSNPESDPGQLRETVVALADDWLTHARLDGDKLIVDLDSPKLGVAGSAMTKAIMQARAAVFQAASQSHIEQMIQSMVIYTNGHNGAYPDSLEDLAKYLATSGIAVGDIMANPARPDQKIGYVYVKPTQGGKTPADHIIIYEKQDAFGLGVTVGFVDGHTERIKNEAAFKKLLDVAQGSGK